MVLPPAWMLCFVGCSFSMAGGAGNPDVAGGAGACANPETTDTTESSAKRRKEQCTGDSLDTEYTPRNKPQAPHVMMAPGRALDDVNGRTARDDRHLYLSPRSVWAEKASRTGADDR